VAYAPVVIKLWSVVFRQLTVLKIHRNTKRYISDVLMSRIVAYFRHGGFRLHGTTDFIPNARDL